MRPLSICLIVKNEEAFLPGCLETVKDQAAQIVVVDTGSEDRTREIAKDFGAELAYFSWCDDFSAARNYAAELATEDWVLSLDADHRLDANFWRGIDEILKSPAAEAYTFLSRNYKRAEIPGGQKLSAQNSDEALWIAQGFTSYLDNIQPFLFRKRPGIEWQYPVHETFLPSARAHGYRCAHKTFIIHHLGLDRSEEELQRKEAWYLKLLVKKTRQNPNDHRAWFETGLSLTKLGHTRAAVQSYEEALKLKPDWPEALRNLSLLHLHQNNTEAAQQRLEEWAMLEPQNAFVQTQLDKLNS